MTLFFDFDKVSDSPKLHAEIFGSGLGDVLEHVSLFGTLTRVAVDNSITPAEEALLSGVVDAHLDVPLPPEPPTSGVFVNTIGEVSGIVHLDVIGDGMTITAIQETPAEARLQFDPLFNSASGTLLEQASASGISVELFFTPASGTDFVLEHSLNTNIFTWDMWATAFDPIRTIQPTNVYPSGNDHVAIELDIPDSGRLILTAGGTGAAGPQGPPGPLASGACSVHNFEPSNGTLFVVTHALNTEDFIWSMWNTDSSPFDTTIIPTNVAPSGVNHAIIELDIAMSGKLVIQGCSSSGISVGDVIATKTVSDSYNVTNLDSAIFVDASTGAKTITLLNPSGVEGKSLYVKKIDSAGTIVTLNANGSGLIDGSNTAIIIAQYDALRVIAHNGNWWIL